jgi:hypothetical protein
MPNFSPKNTDTPDPFRPAVQYLLSTGKPRTPQTKHRRGSSSDSLDYDSDRPRPRMPSYNPKSSNDSRETSIPLINISRIPSPSHAQQHSNLNIGSDTDDDEWGESYADQRPFLSQEEGRRLSGWRGVFQGGGFGQIFFATNLGWSVYIGILVLWLGGCEISLTVINRIILWSGYLKDHYTEHTELFPMITGVYKFPYPLTTILFQMLITHFFVILSAYTTRWTTPWLISAGFSGAISPSRPLQSPSSPGFRGQGKSIGFSEAVKKWATTRSGGIAGGGFFEFEWPVVKQVLPLAIIFVLKVTLSNISFTYAQLSTYYLARIGIVPISLLLTAILSQQKHSFSVLVSALIATVALLVACWQSNIRLAWESIVAGVLSSFFVALYPIQLQRTYRSLASLVPQGDLLTTIPSTNPHPSNPALPPDASGSPQESRAYWRLLHYTSLLSILIFLPLPFLTGEIANIAHHGYILDVSFHWIMAFCGGLGSWAVFCSTIALTRATSPLTVSFLNVPRAAFLLPIMSGWKMSNYAWIGIGICWASCAWFLRARWKNGGRMGG